MALAIALFAGCQGGRVGGQSGTEGCMPEDDLFRAELADAGPPPDDDGGFDTTTLIGHDSDQCPAEP